MLFWHRGKEEMKKTNMKTLLKGISLSYLHVLELWSSPKPLTEDFLFLAISISKDNKFVCNSLSNIDYYVLLNR